MVFLFICISGYTQYEIDALRFSRLNPSGTARWTATGNSFSAIGADFSTISTNPAGLGLFRTTQITVSPSMYIATSVSDYGGQAYDDDRFNINLGNLGMVFRLRYNKGRTKGIQFLNIALGYNRIQNFNRSIYFRGEDSQFSLGNVFQGAAQGKDYTTLAPFFEQLAFNSYLIDTAGGASQYISNGMLPGDLKTQSLQLTTKGSGGEFTAAGAINFANRIYAGASFAINRLVYDETSTFTEEDLTGLSPGFTSLSYTEKYRASGVGVNFKFGIIARPLDWLRVGFAFHTPTWYSFDETYSNALSTSLSIGNYQANSPLGIFEYRLTTPWRIQGSLGFTVLKFALIGVEYELVDYRVANLRPSQNAFIGPNAYIDTAYQTTHNIRIGIEGRIDPFRIRAGYNFSMNPFRSSTGIDATTHQISVGAGYQSRKWFSLDLAYIVGISNGVQYMNRNFIGQPPAQVSNRSHNIVFTFGIRLGKGD